MKSTQETCLRKRNKFINKLFLLLSSVLIIGIQSLTAQVVINEDDADGDSNAYLDVQSTTKGVVFPVMTEAERDAIPSPAKGLLVFNRSGGYHNYYDGINWLQINRSVAAIATNLTTGSETDIGVGVGIADPDNSAILHVNSTSKGFLLPRPTSTPAAITGMIYYGILSNNLLIYNGSEWTKVSTTSSTVGASGSGTSAGVLVGTGTIDASAKMEVRTSNKGMLIPRLTDAERDDILSPIEGLTIYNTTDNSIQYYLSGTWFKWTTLTNDYGQIVTNPGRSCKDIYNSNGATQGVDGTYYIDPDGLGGNSAYACTCDMTTDGGGWTLVENTGPKKSATNTTNAVGSAPISTLVGTSFNKISDADINLIRGDYSTSILRIQRPNGNASAYDIYFLENIEFNSNAANTFQIQDFYTSYADALTTTNMYTGTATHTSGFSTWTNTNGNNYAIIWNYGSEGLISNLGVYACEGAGPSNRSECNALLWVK